MLLLALAVAGVAWLWTVRPAPARPAGEPRDLTGATVSGPSESAVAIARDGSFLVFIGRSATAPDDTTLLRMGATDREPTALFATSGLRPQSPFISADGRWVGFISAGQLMKVAASGGTPALICACGAESRGGAAWLDDGSIVFRAGRLLRLLAPDGRTRRDLTRVPPQSAGTAHGFAAALPQANRVLFTIFTGDVHSSSVALLDLVTGKERVLRQGARFGMWVDPDVLVFVDADDQVRATHVDPETFDPIGAEAVVERGPVFTSRDAGSLAVARSGTLAFAAGESVVRGRSLWWVTRDGTERRAPLPPQGYTYPRISPDGRSVALDVRNETFNIHLWRLDDNSLQPLTTGRRNGYPAWFADGRSLLYSSDRDGVDAVFALPLERPEQPRKVASGRRPLIPYAVSPDNGAAVVRVSRIRGFALAVAAIDGSATVERLVTPDQSALNAALSPDGRWLAFQAGDAARAEIYVQPLAGPASAAQQVSTGGGYMPVWGPSATELLYVDASHELMHVVVSTTEGHLQLGNPARVFPSTYSSTGWFHGPNGRTFDVSPDGERFLVIRDEEERQDMRDRTLHVRVGLTRSVPRLTWWERVSIFMSTVIP